MLEAGNEYDVELQPLGGMHGHQLYRFLPLSRLMFAGFERGVREEGGERVGVGRVGQRIGLLLHEAGRRVDQFVEVLQPLATFLFAEVVLAQAALLDQVVDHFG